MPASSVPLTSLKSIRPFAEQTGNGPYSSLSTYRPWVRRNPSTPMRRTPVSSACWIVRPSIVMPCRASGGQTGFPFGPTPMAPVPTWMPYRWPAASMTAARLPRMVTTLVSPGLAASTAAWMEPDTTITWPVAACAGEAPKPAAASAMSRDAANIDVRRPMTLTLRPSLIAPSLLGNQTKHRTSATARRKPRSAVGQHGFQLTEVTVHLGPVVTPQADRERRPTQLVPDRSAQGEAAGGERLRSLLHERVDLFDVVAPQHDHEPRIGRHHTSIE